MLSSPIPPFLRSRWASVRVAGVVFALGTLTALALPADLGNALTAENGPVETLQAMLFFALAAGVCLFRRRDEHVWTTCSLAIVLFAVGARELDWHKAGTGGSVLKPRFYLGPAAPGAKLLAVVVLLVLATALIHLLRRHLREMWDGLRKRQPIAITAATFFAVLVLSRIADKSGFGGPSDPEIVAARQIIEEMLELLLPLLVLLGAFQRNVTYEALAALRSRRETRARSQLESVSGSGLP